MTNVLEDFAADVAKPESTKPTYTATHATVALSDNVTAQGVKRDTDGVAFIAITRTRADGESRTTYDRADRVASYLAKLGSANESGTTKQ